MNILSRIPSPFSVDGAYVWFQVFSLLFLTATILTGAGTIITGFIANRRTANALAIQQERAAKAETTLKLLESERQPRHLTPKQVKDYRKYCAMRQAKYQACANRQIK